MENIELSKQPAYQPHFNSINEIAGNLPHLDPEQLIGEISRLKFGLNLQTMQLLKEASQLDLAQKGELSRLIRIIALADIPDVEELLEEKNKAQILEILGLVKTFRSQMPTTIH